VTRCATALNKTEALGAHQLKRDLARVTPVPIAEVVRDLHRAENQPEQSYSERQLYESALDRMAREVAAIESIDREAAVGILTKSLTKAVVAV